MSEIASDLFCAGAATDGLPPVQRSWAMITYSIGLSMSVLDGNIANTALPAIAKQLHASPADSIWVVNAFLLAVAICVVPLSSLVDIIGYKRVYQAGLAIFTIASAGCSLPHSLQTLVLARVLQGVGAACIWSVSAAVMRYTYPRALLGHGIGFGLLSLSLSERHLAPAEGTRHRWDLWSAALNAVTVTLLITGIDGLGRTGNGRAVAAELFGALVGGVLLVRRQISLTVPMLAIDLFKRPIFALSSAASLCAFMGQGLAFVVLPFYFIDGLGFSQVMAGLLLTPWPIAAGAMSHFSGRLADRYAVRLLGPVGMCGMTAGLLLLAWAPAHPTTFQIVWRAALGGAGFGFFGAPNNRAMVASASRERSGGAGGISTMSRLLGQSIGVSVVAVIFGLSAHGGATLHDARVALMFGGVFTILSGLISSAPQPHLQPE
jgi:DHA2 family multidrug resistance protein-like MFS transporter